MEQNDSISELKELIGKNQFKDVLKILSKNKEGLKNRNLVNELIMLKREYGDIKQRERLGLSLSKERTNEFTWKLLQLVDKIEKSDEFIFIDKIESSSSNQNISFGVSLTIFGISVLGITMGVQAGFTITSIISGIFMLILISLGLYIYEKIN